MVAMTTTMSNTYGWPLPGREKAEEFQKLANSLLAEGNFLD